METGLSTLDDVARERRRIADQLARLDDERAKLSEELAELDAAERVLLRLGQLTPHSGNGTESDHDHAPRRGRPWSHFRSAAQRAKPSLGDAVLQAIEALGSGVSAAEVRNYLARECSMRVRANHLGMALQRHRRAGRLEQHEGRWSLTGSGDA